MYQEPKYVGTYTTHIAYRLYSDHLYIADIQEAHINDTESEHIRIGECSFNVSFLHVF